MVGHPSVSRNWFLLQAIIFAICLGMVASLFLYPTFGLHAFWDVLIPIAPAILVLFPGFWRNICPVATISQLPRHLRISKRKKMSVSAHGWAVCVGVILLLLIIPFRHTYFDLNGPATATFLIVATLLAIGLSTWFDGKSGWCAGLCPIHQVEKLYGQRPAMSFHNAHCATCVTCVNGCPDSTPAPSLHLGGNSWPRRAAAFGLIGCFPGYIWGWFHVQDYAVFGEGLRNIIGTYTPSIAGGVSTLIVYGLLIRLVSLQQRRIIDRLFAAAAISCYYWFRLPWLIGFSQFDGNGMLVDLSDTVPPSFVTLLPFCTTAFWLWWIVLRSNGLHPWLRRPPNANGDVALTVSA